MTFFCKRFLYGYSCNSIVLMILDILKLHDLVFALKETCSGFWQG